MAARVYRIVATAAGRPAFTLVELLVVIAVLAVLLSILLPSLGAARAQAQAGVCASNLRQVALANELYANDHEHRYCPGAADFIDVWIGTFHWPTFNVADMAVTCGAVVLALVLWQEGRQGDESAAERAGPAEA